MQRQEHIYSKYVREDFAPFVHSQLDALWEPDQFARISHVLSGENYFRQPPHSPVKGPPSRNTKHILNWLRKRTKRSQTHWSADSDDRPSRSVRCNTVKSDSSSDTQNSRGTPTGSAPQCVSREHLISHRDLMYQLSAVMDDLSISQKLKHVTTIRFFKFLLHKKLLRPYTAGNATKSKFRRYYYWNRTLNTPPKVTTPKTNPQPTAVTNMDEIVKSQMLDLIKYQRGLIQHLQQEVSKTNLDDLCLKLGFQSMERASSEFRGKRRRESLGFLSHGEKIPSTSKHYMSPKNSPGDDEKYFDVHQCNSSSMEISRPMSTATNIEGPVPKLTLQMPSTNEDAHSTASVESGFVFQIKNRVFSWQSSLFSTVFGLKSLFFKGSPGSQENTARWDGTDRQNYKVTIRRNRMRRNEDIGDRSYKERKTDLNNVQAEKTRLDLETGPHRIGHNIQYKISESKENTTFDKNPPSDSNDVQAEKTIRQELEISLHETGHNIESKKSESKDNNTIDENPPNIVPNTGLIEKRARRENLKLSEHFSPKKIDGNTDEENKSNNVGPADKMNLERDVNL